MKLSKVQREQLKQKFNGHCAYCGCVLDNRFHADHVVSIRRKSVFAPAPAHSPFSVVLKHTGECENPELDCFENLMPACSPCNLYKGGNSLEGWREQLHELNRKLFDYSKHYRFALAFGQVKETPKPIIFYFERLGVGISEGATVEWLGKQGRFLVMMVMQSGLPCIVLTCLTTNTEILCWEPTALVCVEKVA